MTKIFKPVCVMVVLGLVLSMGVVLAPETRAQVTITNGGFETGDVTGWTVNGSISYVEVLQATNFTPNIGVPDGSYFVLLSNGPWWPNPPDEVGDLDGNGAVDVNSSTLSQIFTLSAGEVPATLSFQWSFLSAEVAPGVPPYSGYDYDDFFRVRLDGTNILTGSVPGAAIWPSPFPDVPPLDGTLYTVTSSGPTASSYFDDGMCSFQTFTYPITTAGTYTLEFLVADQGGNGDIDSGLLIDAVSLEVQALDADFSADPTSGIAPLEVDFTDLSVGDIVSWSWDFGDTGTSALQNPSHTYTAAGTYTVGLTVTDSGENTDTETKIDYITVYEGVNADFSATPTSGTAALEVDFTDLSVGDIDTRSWDFGDGGTSSDQNPTYEYTRPGTYDVSLTVSGDGGEDTETKSDYIEVSPATIYSNCATTEPAIDGAFGSDEWSDATELDFLAADPDNQLEAYGYFMNDDEFLYIAIDVPDDITEDMADATTLAFDTGNDGEYTVGHDDVFGMGERDGGLTWHLVWGAEDNGGGYTDHCVPFDTSEPLHGGLDGDWGLGSSPNSATDHRIYEYRIPLDLLLASPGDTIGFAMDGIVLMGIYDDDTDLGDQWPFLRWDPIDIDEYGDLVLSVCAPEERPRIDVRVVPTASGEAPLTVRFVLEETGTIDEYLWRFGDGATSRERTPSHTFYNEGIYTVNLTVSGPGGEARDRVEIVVEAGATPSRLAVRNLNINPVQAKPRQAITISANIVNEGGIWGSQTVNLLINGQSEQSLGVGVSPGSASPVRFTVYKVEAGEYRVTIGDATGTFYVTEEAAARASEPPGLLPAGVFGELDTGAIIAIVVIGIILVGGVILVVLLARRV